MYDTIMFFDDYKEDVISKEDIRPSESYIQYLGRMSDLYMGSPILPEINEEDLPIVPGQVVAGQWMWECAACGSGIIFPEPDMDGNIFSLCPACHYLGWVEVVLPYNWVEIENELLKQPGFRSNTSFRNWEPGWTLEKLRERTASAERQIAEGNPKPRKASFGTTRLWSVSEVVTANKKNTHERQVLRDIMGRAGPAGPWENAIHLWNATSSQRDGITAESGMILFNTTGGHLDAYHGGWNRVVRAWRSTETYAFNTVHTVQHTLGTIPVGYQLSIVNSEDGVWNGWAPGEEFDFLTFSSWNTNDSVGPTLRSAVFDKTSSEVKFVIYTDSNNNDQFWAINGSGAKDVLALRGASGNDWEIRITLFG